MDDENDGADSYELVELIRQKGTVGLEQWREAHPNAPIVLRDATLHDCDLSYANLSAADLSGASLSRINLRGASLQSALFLGAILCQVDLSEARLEKANFTKSKLKATSLCRAQCIQTSFRDAGLTYTDATSASLTAADFQTAELTCVLLARANIDRANFRGAILKRVDLSNAQACNAVFSGTQIDDTTCHETNLSAALLDSAYFIDADCSSASFYKADLRRTVFIRSLLRAADLGLADLSGSQFIGADMKSAILRSAIVSGETLFDDSTDEGELRLLLYDDKTDCTGVGLGNARLSPGFRADLEYNIRKIYWTKRYRQSQLDSCAAIFWWPFWLVTDYGRSTGRILLAFAVFSFLFSLVYMIGTLPAPPGWSVLVVHQPLVQNLHKCKGPDDKLVDLTSKPLALWCRSMYFSIVTMTTLGFGDISVNPNSPLGHIVISFQVLLGYVLLGSMITRLAIQFQSVG